MSDMMIVMIVCLVIWVGIFFYLLHLDTALKKIRQKLEFKENVSKSEH